MSAWLDLVAIAPRNHPLLPPEGGEARSYDINPLGLILLHRYQQ